MSVTHRIARIISAITGKKDRTAAVLLAGGVGSRMQSENGTTKQLMLLHGEPVILHTVRAFEACPYIHEIVVVSRHEEIDRVRAILTDARIRKLRCIVEGGETRLDSAARGFEAISDEVNFVAVHDVARCMVTPDMISDVVASAYETKAASAAYRVTDTVKIADRGGYVKETPDRNTLWAATTPQVFYADLYRAALCMAEKDGLRATDDNMMIEHVGHRVKLIDCGSENLKITTKADLIMAEVILRLREAKKQKKKGGKK